MLDRIKPRAVLVGVLLAGLGSVALGPAVPASATTNAEPLMFGSRGTERGGLVSTTPREPSCAPPTGDAETGDAEPGDAEP